MPHQALAISDRSMIHVSQTDSNMIQTDLRPTPCGSFSRMTATDDEQNPAAFKPNMSGERQPGIRRMRHGQTPYESHQNHGQSMNQNLSASACNTHARLSYP